MRKLFSMLWVLTIISFAQQPLNFTLHSNFNPYPSVGYNDCWGYTDSQGREYALLGVQNGLSIVNITNPAQPVQVAFIPGPSSIWRDIKTHSHYAYVTTEGTGTGKGLQIIDLSQLPTTASLANTVTTWFNRAHNIYIDNGFAYVIGTDNGGGMHILDLSNPVNPVRTAYYTASSYIHDVYVWNDTAYASAEDTYDMIDVRNKSLPVKINSSPALPGIYAHSGWLTEDKRYFIACEEFNIRDITVWDLADRSSWNLVVSQWQAPATTPVHNVFVKGNYAHIAYYKEGYVVLDISNPLNPTMVGQYDTYPSTSGTYEGCWGVYPYFPSGTVIASDISTGLYILDFTLDNTVPVELISFTHKINYPFIQLTWETRSELNNKGFEIQKSIDGEYWSYLDFINGFGTTASNRKYSFIDKIPTEGKSFYRLVQIDYDGTRTNSNMIEVDFNKSISFSLEQNYPNPFNPTTKIKYSIGNDVNYQGNTVIKIYDVLGNEIAEILNEKKAAGEYEIEFNANSLAAGIYLYKLSSGDFVLTKKLILLK